MPVLLLFLLLLPCVSPSHVTGRVRVVGEKRRDEELLFPRVGVPQLASRLAVHVRPAVHVPAPVSSGPFAATFLGMQARPKGLQMMAPPPTDEPPPALAAPSAGLLAMLTSEGLSGKSYVCGPAASQRIEAACAELEASAAKPSWPRDLMAIDGEWRLLYSSALAGNFVPDAILSGGLKDLLADAPITPRDVRQKIDVTTRRIVNVVSLAPWPAGLPSGQLLSAPGPLGPLGEALLELQDAKVTLELDHSFSVEGEGGDGGGPRRAATASSIVKLNLERVRRTLDGMPPPGGDGSLALSDLIPRESDYEIPAPLTVLAAGAFDTTYVDEHLRISRGVPAVAGLPAELRVFQRTSGRGKRIFRSWQEEEEALTAAAAAGVPIPGWEDRWQEGGSQEAFDEDMPD